MNKYCHISAGEIPEHCSALTTSRYKAHYKFWRTVWWKIVTSLVTSFFEMGKRLNGIMGLERAVFEENAGLKGVTKKKVNDYVYLRRGGMIHTHMTADEGVLSVHLECSFI